MSIECHVITHVANKMITIIWHMVVNEKLYNERKHTGGIEYIW